MVERLEKEKDTIEPKRRERERGGMIDRSMPSWLSTNPSSTYVPRKTTQKESLSNLKRRGIYRRDMINFHILILIVLRS